MGDTDHQSTDDLSDSGGKRTLTRRDAIGALTAAGVTSVAGCSSLLDDSESSTADASTDGNHEQATMQALATVLYPSEIEVTEDFLQTYLYSRIVDEEGYETELQSAVETLDALATDQHDGDFRALDTEQQEAVIMDSDVHSGASEADGTAVERLNYYLVDELLFAFYSSPTGGELVGNMNPRGWPGGFGYSAEVPE